jgi:myotubularin-related protein 1/2
MENRAVILSAIGPLLPGENVSMFLTHLHDVKDTASSHTGIGTDGFGHDSNPEDLVWCCLLTFYRIAVFSFKESEFLPSSITTPSMKSADRVKEWLEAASVSKHFQYMFISQKKEDGKTHHVLQMPVSSVERIEKFSGTIQTSSQLYASPIPMITSNSSYSESANELMPGGTIILYSKDNGRFIQFATDSYADFNKAYNAIHANAFPGRTNLAYLYAFEARRSEVQSSTKVIDGVKRITSIATPRRYDPLKEFNRMIRIDDDTKCPWQPYLNANANYSMCSSYPSITFGPSTVDDKTPNGMTLIRQTAAFRSGGRMQTLVWASRFDGASIWRCSQPRVGFQGNRSTADELFIKHIGECAALANAQAASKGQILERPNVAFLKMLTGGNNESDLMLETFVEKDLVAFSERCLVKIFDLRPKSSAVANRTQGYGYENTSYYRNTTLSFHGIGNIHAVRDSYQKLNALCNSSTVHDAQWMQLVEETKWLSSIRAILSASWQAAFHVRYNRLPVLLHCSHGWDRTSQVSALSQLLLDPFYRTRVGFSCLVEKEFLALGHPFRLRSGHGERRGDKNSNTLGTQLDEGQLSPIFIQFLDCVFQIVNQYPNFFEFNTKYLLVISDHVYSCRFGTFLTDTEKERELFYSIRQRTHCLWQYLDDKSELINADYNGSSLGDQEHEGKGALLMPLSSLLRNVSLWTERHCMYSAKASLSPFPYGCMTNKSDDIFICDAIQGENSLQTSKQSLEKEVERWKSIAEDKENELLMLRKKLKEREEEDQITKLSLENEICHNGFDDVQDFVNDLDKL